MKRRSLYEEAVSIANDLEKDMTTGNLTHDSFSFRLSNMREAGRIEANGFILEFFFVGIIS